MRFLIQRIDKEVRHDFSFTLLESIRYHNWLDSVSMEYVFIDDLNFNNKNIMCTPIGSVEFVSEYIKFIGGTIPKPINVPNELIQYANRDIYNINFNEIENLGLNEFFIKSGDKIKGFSGLFNKEEIKQTQLSGNYQVSSVIDIQSEWRCFVYKNELVGLQNYSGDFTLFPNVSKINEMIYEYKSSPIAYTLDVGVSKLDRSTVLTKTFVIECHDFFSVGLYGFSNHKILPHMFNRWFIYNMR